MDEEKEKKSILIVEDEGPQREALVDTFSHEGFHVMSARNGEEGFTRALGSRPDIILLDIVMPIMDGMTMLKKLRRENLWGKTVPVVLLTNLSSDSEERLRDVTITEPSYYLVKSDWTLADVVEKVKERLATPA